MVPFPMDIAGIVAKGQTHEAPPLKALKSGMGGGRGRRAADITAALFGKLHHRYFLILTLYSALALKPR